MNQLLAGNSVFGNLEPGAVSLSDFELRFPEVGVVSQI